MARTDKTVMAFCLRGEECIAKAMTLLPCVSAVQSSQLLGLNFSHVIFVLLSSCVGRKVAEKLCRGAGVSLVYCFAVSDGAPSCDVNEQLLGRSLLCLEESAVYMAQDQF
jgi:hypothetical protein